MKKIICFVLLMFLLSGCSNQSSHNTESEPVALTVVAESAAPIASTAASESMEQTHSGMSEEVYNRSMNDMIAFIDENGACLGEFSTFLQNNSEVISGEEFYLSENEEFSDLQKRAIELCDPMIQYDTSEMSEEMQYCFELLSEFAEITKEHWEDIGEKISPEQFDEISSEYQEAFSDYLSEIFTLQIKAMIAYLEENNGDPETIANLKKSIGEEETTNSGNSSSNNSKFTNKYGTATTICAHSGCNKYIASTGDTNCCTTHSNKCLNCKKYIDEDAMYCMSCLSASKNSSSNSGSSSSSSTNSSGCGYKYSSGKVCGANVGSHAPLCDKHFKELNDTYNALTGNK